MLSRGYPGESQSKSAARVFVYRVASDAPRIGHAVALAGPTPESEVDLMKNYLRWPGERTHFVDWARDTLARSRVLGALDNIKKIWPEANVRHADINQVVAELPSIGFANLDFMGFSRTSVMPCVQSVIGRLVPNGVMALTWFRGREVDSPERSAWDIFEAARDIPDIENRRCAGVLRLVDGWGKAQGVNLKLRGAVEYLHFPKSRYKGAMSVAVWQRSSNV